MLEDELRMEKVLLPVSCRICCYYY